MSIEDLHPNIPSPLNLIMVPSPEKLAQSCVLNTLLLRIGRHFAIEKIKMVEEKKKKRYLTSKFRLEPRNLIKENNKSSNKNHKKAAKNVEN